MIFEGKKFWVAQRVPMRSTYLEEIRKNGGEIVLLEKQADYLIADHMKSKFAPAGSISFTFIEDSVKNGAIVDPEDHRCGVPAGAVRDISSPRPSKVTREPYTTSDDRICYRWAKSAECKGASVGGNEIWKQLEAKVSLLSLP